MNSDLQWLVSKLTELQEREFYGEVEVSMEAGQVKIVRKVEKEKPPK